MSSEKDSSLFKIHNFAQHPTRREFYVFHFSQTAMANEFEHLLNTEGIYFERHDANDLVRKHLFGVKRIDLEKAEKLNNIAIGKHRKPFISDPVLRYVVIATSLLVILLAIIGYLKS